MGVDDIFYIGYSAVVSLGAGLATHEIINGNYLSAAAIGAINLIPAY